MKTPHRPTVLGNRYLLEYDMGRGAITIAFGTSDRVPGNRLEVAELRMVGRGG